MSRTHPIARALVAIGGIVAVAVAAASLRSPVEFGAGDGGDGIGTGEGDGFGVGGQPPPPGEPTGVAIPAFLEYLGYALIVLLAIVLVWYLVAHRRRVVTLVAVVLLAAVVLAAVVEFAPPIVDSQSLPSGPPGIAGGGGSSSGDGDTIPISIEPLFVVLAFVAAIFVGGVLLSSDRETAPPVGDESTADEPEAPSETATAVGATAGRAADSVDDGAAIDNEIYRAWREMTALLEVDRPESTTPREFAAAAVDAGIDPADADALTRLFEDVRYGGVEVTPPMEERAVSVFRRIETEYAGDDTTEQDDRRADRRDRSGGGLR